MLPLYLKLGMSPVVLTCVAGLANGTLNIVPWGGPTARAAAALGVSPTDIFVPMIPSLGAGILLTLLFAWWLGVSERNRLSALGTATVEVEREMGVKVPAGVGSASGSTGSSSGGFFSGRFGSRSNSRMVSSAGLLATQPIAVPGDAPALTDTMLDPERPTLRPKLLWFNVILTVVVLVFLIADQVPLAYVFMVGSAIALVVNFPNLKEQAARVVAHSSSIVGVVSMVLAAGVLIGVLNGTGMVEAMSNWLVSVIPDSMGGFLAVITGLLSIPMTFFLSNDAFYFGILPVLSESAANFGISPVEMARASITGQPVHLQSPLVPAILLLVSLAGVNLGDHHKKVLWRAVLVSLAMLAVGVLTTAVPIM